MNEILLILHLFGFSAAVAASIGNFTIMQLVNAAPGDAPVLGKAPPILARVGQIGLGLLWLTGLIMVWSVFGGPSNLPGIFWLKFICVLGVTAGVVMLGLTLKEMQSGNRAAASRLPLYGSVTTGLLVLVVIFAVFAFD